MNEADIREIIAADLSVIDARLMLVKTEHEIILADGRRVAIDILAKDEFGCFTIIEIKKSNQTSRSTVQQLYKYAAFLKRKNRLRVDQIRCIAASTDWDELNAPFSEFKHFSEYESIGLKIILSREGTYSVNIVDFPYEEGGGEPLQNFIFFEFKRSAARDAAQEALVRILNSVAPQLSSAIVTTDYKGNDPNIVNPFGFSWTIFRVNTVDIEESIVKLEEKDALSAEDFDMPFLLQSLHDGTFEAELRELILTKMPIIHAKEGEFSALAIHSLNNTLSTWQTRKVSLLGSMYEDGIYSEDEAVFLACGFTGSHPYNFVSKATPERQAGFNFVRTKLDLFLATNSRWKKAVSLIFNSANTEDELSIRIYNPLNFFGMLVDLYRDGQTSRIPSAKIISVSRSRNIHYFGTVIWSGMVSRIRFRDALKYAYQDERIAILRAFNQWMTEYDEKLFHKFSIRHEFFRVINEETEWLNIDEEPPCWEKSKKDIESLNLFFPKHGRLVKEAGKFFGERSV